VGGVYSDRKICTGVYIYVWVIYLPNAFLVL
jgi:hypothetical protein